MSTPSTRPVHPCLLSLTEATRGAEFSTWAHITSNQSGSGSSSNALPNLVIAAASTLTVYSVDPSSGTLWIEHQFGPLDGELAFLGTLTSPPSSNNSRKNNKHVPDALLAGFCGHARLSVLRVRHDRLQADSLLDLTGILTQHSYGALVEQDVQIALTSASSRPGVATVACILGGGVAVAVLEVSYHAAVDGWVAVEPYVIPLAALAQSSLPHVSAAATTGQVGQAQQQQQQLLQQQQLQNAISTGFGDMYSLTFLPGFCEPVLVLLHSEPGGRVATGRLGREKEEQGRASGASGSGSGSGSTPLYVTALSLSVAHNRTAVLWCRPVSTDALYLKTVGSTLISVGANTVICMDCSAMGNLIQVLAVNGWARSTCPAELVPHLAANPFLKLALQLDGSCLTALSESTALVALRSGQLYVLQQSVTNVWSLLPAGQALGAVGEVTLLTCLGFADQTVASFVDKKLLGQSTTGATATTTTTTAMGLIFAGSRLGDSVLLGYALETQEVGLSMDVIVPVKKEQNDPADAVKQESSTAVKQEETSDNNSTNHGNHQSISGGLMSSMVDEEYDKVLQIEEDALYAPTAAESQSQQQQQQQQHTQEQQEEKTKRPNIVPPSDDDDEGDDEAAMQQQGRKRARRVAKITMIRSLTPLDALVNPGPLGPSVEGPIAPVPAFLADRDRLSSSGGGGGRQAEGSKESSCLFGASAFVFPAGFGSSGGLALVTVPGRDDRTIVAEEDCMDVRGMFSLPQAGYVLLGMSSRQVEGNGISVLRIGDKNHSAAGGGAAVGGSSKEMSISEVDSSSLGSLTDGGGGSGLMFSSTRDVLSSTLLGAGEFSDGNFALCVKTTSSSMSDDDLEQQQCGLVVLNQNFDIVAQFPLDNEANNANLVRLTPFSTCNQSDGGPPAIAFGCLWSSGTATVVVCAADGGSIRSFSIDPGHVSKEEDPMDEDDEEDEDERRLREFYSDPSIVAVDIFKAPRSVFESTGRAKAGSSVDPETDNDVRGPDEREQQAMEIEDQNSLTAERKDWNKLTVAMLKVELEKRGIVATGKKADLVQALEESDFQKDQQSKNPAVVPLSSEGPTDPKGPTVFPSGRDGEVLEYDEEDKLLYATGDGADTSQPQQRVVGVDTDDLQDYVAVCRQSGRLEVYSLENDGLHLRWEASGCGIGSVVLGGEQAVDARNPSSLSVHVNEMRFFACGPTDTKPDGNLSARRRFCLILETTNGDQTLYMAVRRTAMSETPQFVRVPTRSVFRSSKEQARHHAKLVRKKIVGTDARDKEDSFAMNSLHRFSGISGQDGLFAAGFVPRWIVSNRGKPTWLHHRTRHASPAGATERPVRAFCSAGNNEGFLVLHERVGRVGSQRLTLFDGISGAFDSHGLLLGSGLCLETRPLGVTVRQIHYVADESVSSGSHPLFVLLVSRELEKDQREWNSDGLTPEQRKAIEEEKEKAKIQKQVEADLGGFDLQSEWVEEIERENCFDIDLELGGAPPVPKSSYSLWIVDTANNWSVVDSYELGEHEHGLAMKTMSLTEFKAEPGRSGTVVEVDDDVDDIKIPFIALGTGIVDHNGEDVSCKGRALLFRLALSRGSGGPIAELSLAYEKDIFHGPVTSLSCLSVEGKNRLVIGAGPDINIEQWGNNKLTQVGFFRATMHILNVIHFKNFFLLSDAYDSLHFLVWRESDKSLTLLAKDYDPIPVYAAGLMSRGAAMTFLCHDDRQNIQFFQYAPGEAAARGGNRLVCQGDVHLGSQTTAFLTHYCRSSLLVHSATPTSTHAALKQQDSYFGRTDDDQRLGVYYGTTDGGIGSIVPLSEPVFWRLTALQSVLANALETNCALSQRAWRLYRRTPRRGGCRSNDRKKSVIDGDLLLQYADLPVADQEDLAASIGSTVDLILDNLLEVQCGSYMI